MSGHARAQRDRAKHARQQSIPGHGEGHTRHREAGRVQRAKGGDHQADRQQRGACRSEHAHHHGGGDRRGLRNVRDGLRPKDVEVACVDEQIESDDQHARADKGARQRTPGFTHFFSDETRDRPAVVAPQRANDGRAEAGGAQSGTDWHTRAAPGCAAAGKMSPGTVAVQEGGDADTRYQQHFQGCDHGGNPAVGLYRRQRQQGDEHDRREGQ